MRLLSVTKSTGGLARYNRRLCRRLVADGHRVDVVCLSDGAESYAGDLRADGLRTTSLPMARYRLAPASDLRLASRLVRHVRHGGYDAILGHGSKAGFLVRVAGRIAGTPAVYRLASMSFVERTQGRRAALYRQLERAGASLGGHIVTVAHSVREELIRRRIARPSAISTIHTGIDPAELGRPLARADACAALGLDPGRAVVGWAARLVPQKAPLDFLAAAALVVERVPSVQVFMAGDGPLAGDVRRSIDRLGLAGHVVSAPWQEDVARMLSALDVYVLSSRWEGLPQSLLEAMALGRASVATAVDGSREVLRDGIDGALVTAGDHEAMAARIVTLLRDVELRERMGRSAARHARRRFTVDRMAGEWVELLGRISRAGGSVADA